MCLCEQEIQYAHRYLSVCRPLSAFQTFVFLFTNATFSFFFSCDFFLILNISVRESRILQLCVFGTCVFMRLGALIPYHTRGHESKNRPPNVFFAPPPPGRAKISQRFQYSSRARWLVLCCTKQAQIHWMLLENN